MVLCDVQHNTPGQDPDAALITMAMAVQFLGDGEDAVEMNDALMNLSALGRNAHDLQQQRPISDIA